MSAPKCKMCGECCKYSWHRYDEDQFEFYMRKNIGTYRGKGLYDGEIIDIIYVPEPCMYLSADNKCMIQSDKPIVCSRHGKSHCHFFPETCVLFDYYKDPRNQRETAEDVGC
jgi:Fe-S-cluster containining protein